MDFVLWNHRISCIYCFEHSVNKITSFYGINSGFCRNFVVLIPYSKAQPIYFFKERNTWYIGRLLRREKSKLLRFIMEGKTVADKSTYLYFAKSCNPFGSPTFERRQRHKNKDTVSTSYGVFQLLLKYKYEQYR